MMLIDLPSGRQSFDYDCGVKALQLVMAYYGYDIREDELMHELDCSRVLGTPPANMIAFAEKHDFKVIAECDVALEKLKQYIDQHIPVIVLVQAWVNRYMTPEEWKKDFEDGHYVIVIGYSDFIVIFEDPASFRKTWMTEEEFLLRWHDRDPVSGDVLNQFAMVLLGKEPIPQHKLLEHMD